MYLKLLKKQIQVYLFPPTRPTLFAPGFLNAFTCGFTCGLAFLEEAFFSAALALAFSLAAFTAWLLCSSRNSGFWFLLATMVWIVAKRNQKPELREEQRSQAVKAAKEKAKAKAAEKKATSKKAKPQVKPQVKAFKNPGAKSVGRVGGKR